MIWLLSILFAFLIFWADSYFGLAAISLFFLALPLILFYQKKIYVLIASIISCLLIYVNWVGASRHVTSLIDVGFVVAELNYESFLRVLAMVMVGTTSFIVMFFSSKYEKWMKEKEKLNIDILNESIRGQTRINRLQEQITNLQNVKTKIDLEGLDQVIEELQKLKDDHGR